MEGGTTAVRKVMVVVDPNREAAGALEYALSHAVVENDTLILFYVENQNAWRNPFGALFRKPLYGGNAVSSPSSSAADGGEGAEVDFLEAMKQACVKAQPNMKVLVERVEMVDGKDNKGSIILAHCSARKIDLLIVGQRRSLSNAILGARRGVIRGVDTAEFLIEHSKCTCVAVQKKGPNAGYLLNSKKHKNFWLLA